MRRLIWVGDDGASIWVDAAGYPTREAHEALALLSSAADEGLDVLRAQGGL